jgi:hypothetical protein
MANPTLYIDTGGHSLGSGSTDTANPTHDSTTNSVTVSVSGTTVTFSGAIDLSTVPTDGSGAIFINDATNSNAKIFKISSVDDGADTLVVSVAPTGTISTSTWGIGGQFVYDSARFEGSLLAGWTVIINDTPASKAADFFTMRATGGSGTGPITFKGADGTMPQLVVTNTSQVIETSGGAGTWKMANLEFIQQGASGANTSSIGPASIRFDNCKWSDSGAQAINNSFATSSNFIFRSEMGGCAGDGVVCTSNFVTTFMHGCYIHDLGGDGIDYTSGSGMSTKLSFCIFDTIAGRGIQNGTTGQKLISNCTFYSCGNSGIEGGDYWIVNSIFMNNGDAAGEYNVEVTDETGNDNIGVHYNNIFYDSGAGDNLSGISTNSTEFTTDPQFTDAANGDFSIGSSSPGKAAGFPGQFLGGPLGYLDIGAVQREEPAAGGGGGGSFTFS